MDYMTGLTQVAITARKAIRYTIFAIIFLMVGKVILDLSIGLYKKIFPSPPPPPTVKFGKLPKLEFPEFTKVNLTYSLETPEGDFPKVPTQAKVYFMPKTSPNLLSLDVSVEKARSLGFTSEPQAMSDTTYRFTNPNFPSAMEINIVTGVFSISYDLNADRAPLERKPPVAEVAASLFRSYLSNADVLPADLTGPSSHEFFKLSEARFITALSLSEADAIKVNLFRKNYDDLPVVTANPNEANVWAIVGGAQERNKQILAAEYHYYPVDESQFATYPIKTPQEAFTELQSGSAYVANQGLVKDGEAIKIRRIYLAYFDPETPGEFLEPIYVFEGDKSFTAYTPAVTLDYYGK
jgi:hypothetical protein